MASAGLGPPTRVQALARGVLAFAWHRKSSAALPNPLEVPSPKTGSRRMLPQEELAWIDELTLQIGPAFKAAIEKAGTTPIPTAP